MADTPVLGLRQYTSADPMNFNEVNGDNQTVDTIPPASFTSATRPTTDLYQGRLIYETDTKNVMMYDLANTTWRKVGTDEKLPAPLRGVCINSAKNITSILNAFANIPMDVARSITVPRPCLISASWRMDMNGFAATLGILRLEWSGATTGNSYDQIGSIMGTTQSGSTSGRESSAVVEFVLNAGTTNFSFGGSRQNNTNTPVLNIASLTVMPIAWVDDFVNGIT